MNGMFPAGRPPSATSHYEFDVSPLHHFRMRQRGAHYAARLPPRRFWVPLVPLPAALAGSLRARLSSRAFIRLATGRGRSVVGSCSSLPSTFASIAFLSTSVIAIAELLRLPFCHHCRQSLGSSLDDARRA